MSSLIGSRICHDLISPIGAITNGLELLGMTGVASGPEMSLIGDSVENAAARIRFFRIAFGLPGDAGVGRGDVVSILSDLAKGGRIRADWQVVDPVARSEARLSFLGLMCLETAMAHGGDVVMRRRAARWELIGRAERMHIDARIWAGLTAAEPLLELEPATVQFALLREGVAEAGRRLEVETAPEQIVIAF